MFVGLSLYGLLKVVAPSQAHCIRNNDQEVKQITLGGNYEGRIILFGLTLSLRSIETYETIQYLETIEIRAHWGVYKTRT